MPARARVVLSTALALFACEGPRMAQNARASLHKLTGSTFEVVPAEGQPAYCLIYTVSKTGGVIRQLTLSKENLSYSCEAGKAVGGRNFRAPLEEGAVDVYVLFTSQRVHAASVAQQLLDLKSRASLSAMDLRLPGTAQLETLEFAPVADAPATVGNVIEPSPAPQ